MYVYTVKLKKINIFENGYIYINYVNMYIADLSSMQDACHMNFVIDLAHRGVSVAQSLEHRSAESV